MSGNRFISLALKNAIVYMLLIVISSFLIGYMLYYKSGTIIKSLSQQELKNNVNIGEVKFGSFIQNIKQDIAFLSSNPYLIDYVSNQSKTTTQVQKDKISKEYFAFLSKKPDYFQLRFISKKGNGKEVIRVERNANELKIANETELQNKGDRDYYRETIKMEPDSIYFSRIDLNKEYGKISQPIIPTLRAACPIYQADTVFGILVLNVDLRQFFSQIKSIANTNYKLYLFNDNGHFLLHPDSTELFGFEYNRPPNLEDYIPISLAKIRNSFQSEQDFFTAEEIFQVKSISYPRKDYSLYLSIGASSAELLSPLQEWRGTSIMITLLITLLFMGLAIWWMKRQTAGLQSITQSMTSFTDDKGPSNLPINRNDEIGILARTFSDMSDTITQNMTTLEQAKEKAEMATKEKEEFLENMSHEIRNPLQSILGMTELLIRNDPKSEQLPLLDTLKFSTNNLHTLVNDVLDYSKLKVGELELVESDTHLDELLKQIVKSYSYQAIKKQIKLDLKIDPQLEAREFATDQLRLTQIVTNLLSNAIKFTPELGSVWIHANLVSQIEDNYTIEIVVKDTGVGIKYENYTHILERFKKADSPQNQYNRHGAGLGLPIIVQLLELFNSHLNIKSEPGKGSEFKFCLTIKKAKKQVTGSLELVPNNDQSLPRKLNVLVFDDDLQTHILYEHLLESIADRFLNIKNQEELSAIPPGSYFDIVLCDYWINGEKITTFIDQLGMLIRPNGICILITGASENPEELLGNQTEFFDLYIQKPIKPDSFLEDLTQTLSDKKNEKALLSNLYQDYDFDKLKVIKAMTMLVTEWKGFETGLLSALSQKDKKGFAIVFHKALSSFRRFELTQLIRICSFLGENIEDEKINSQNAESELRRLMQLHLNFIESELKRWETE